MTPDQKYAHARTFPVHVGVDTSKQFHVVVARGPDGFRKKPYRVNVSREGFDACDRYLTELFPDVPRNRMLIGLEFAGHHGFTFAFDLARRGYEVVNVLPSVTKKTKEIEDNSPLKTDAKDAALICSLTGEGKFVRFPFLKTPFAELRVLTSNRHRLTVEETRFKNRLQGVLDLAWPEFQALFSTIAKPTPLAILSRWPLPADLLAARPSTVYAHVRKASRNVYGREKVDRLIQSARESVALTQASDERRMEIQGILARWRLVRRQIAELDAKIAERVADHAPAQALMSIPEIGATAAATLLAELGTLADYEHPRQVLKLAGLNLYEKSSGQSRGRVKQTKRGRPMLRRQLYLLATRWCKRRGLYRDYYEAMKARNGGPSVKAFSAIARKLVPLLLAVAKSGEPFDEARWRAARHRAAA